MQLRSRECCTTVQTPEQQAHLLVIGVSPNEAARVEDGGVNAGK